MAMDKPRGLELMVVDDDRAAVDYLCTLIEQLQLDVKTVITETDAMRAFKYLRDHPVDLLFLDVEMPVLNGLALLDSLKKRPRVILTTSHARYAMDAYTRGLEECLHKPIDLPRLMVAVERAIGELLGDKPAPPPVADHVFLLETGTTNILKIHFRDIIYVTVSHNDLCIYLPDAKFESRKPLNYILSKLPPSQFIQVNRSDVIAIDYVIAYERKRRRITLRGHKQQITLSKTFRQEFFERVMPLLDLHANEK